MFPGSINRNISTVNYIIFCINSYLVAINILPCVCLGDADAVADRVSQLDQNDLPEMYQAGPCMDVVPSPDPTDETGTDPTDETGTDPTDETGTDPTDETGTDGSGGSSLQPAHLLILLTTLLTFVFILGTFSI